MRIGVFDSGAGGLSVANTVAAAYPEHQVRFVSDAAHLPYGDKSKVEMVELALTVLRPLAAESDVVVIACNTLTTNAIDELRRQLPVPLVGIEPMVKPAAVMSKSHIIAVCATPATLQSRRYADLKQQYAKEVTVLEPDCSEWAMMIESDQIRQQYIHKQIDGLCDAGADVIVLGCTHYHWIEAMVKESAAGRAEVLQPEQAIVSQLGRVLAGL